MIDRKNSVWDDKDGTKLLQYLPELIPETLAAELESELATLIQNKPPKLRKQHRFPSGPNSTNSNKKPRGSYEFLIRQSQGHRKKKPGLSTDLTGSSAQVNASLAFLSSASVHRLIEMLSNALCALDEEIWSTYREKYEKGEKLSPYWSKLGHRNGCFLSLFILVNIYTDPHFDINDIPDGYAVMVTLGAYEGGPLYVSDLKVCLPYKPRDVVFLRSRVLEHFSGPFDGNKRYVLVLTNNINVFSWLEKFGTRVA